MATIPVPITWTAGQVVTAAQMNGLRDALNFLLNPPQAGLRQTVAQSLTTAVTAGLTMDTEDRDNDGGHSTVTNTNRYTCQTAGWFLLHGGAAFASNVTGSRTLFHRVNGGALSEMGANQSVVAAGSVRVVGSTVFAFLNVGDWYEVAANQNSGGALLTDVASGAQSFMTVDYRGTV